MKKRSRLYALLLTLAVLLAAAPAMGAWEKAPGAAYKVSADRPATVGELSSLDKIKASKKDAVTNSVDATAGKYIVRQSIVDAYMAGRSGPVQKPKVFQVDCASVDKKASADKARFIAVAHPLDSAFVGKKPSQLNIIKVLGPNTEDRYSYGFVTSTDQLVDKKFTVLDKDDKAVAADAAIAAESKIVLALLVGGDFDVGSGDCVIDPVFFAAPVSGAAVTGVTVTPSLRVVAAGGSTQLTATVQPSDASQSVTWSSNKTGISVSSSGLVTVSGDVADGVEATITATSESDPTKKGTATVKVGTPVTGVSVAPTSATIAVGGTQQLTATLTPTSPTVPTVTWTSSNTSFATVSGSGLTATVTGVAVGSATITCTTDDGEKQATSAITVTAAPTPPPAPEPGPIPVPVPIPDLPGAIEKPDVGMPSSTSGLPGGYPDLVRSYGGRLVLKSSIIDSISRSIEAASGVSLPVFTGSVSAAGKSAAFAFGLDESGLVGQPVSSLRLVKVKSASSQLEFSRVSKISDLADGKFVIVTSAGVIREANDTVRSTDVLVLVIKDNGVFDMDPTPAVILDPCFLAQSTRRGGGGGGCTAGAFAPMALLLAAPLLLLLKK